MTTIILSSLIMCYSLFAVYSDTKISLTIPVVLYGIFYYLYIVLVKGRGGAPDKILYKDKNILVTVIIYVIMIVLLRNV